MVDRWPLTPPSAAPAHRRITWRNSPRSRPTPPAGFIQPCQPTLVAYPPAGPGWLHEMKHDGYRLIARKDAGRSRTCGPATEPTSPTRCRESSRRFALYLSNNALIDGEAVVFRPDGHSDFVALRTKAGGEQASFVAFDLLSLECADLRQRPLEERREALERLVAGVDGIQFSEALAGRRRDRVRPRLQAGPRGNRVEARLKPLSQRDEPQLAEVPEPGVRRR